MQLFEAQCNSVRFRTKEPSRFSVPDHATVFETVIKRFDSSKRDRQGFRVGVHRYIGTPPICFYSLTVKQVFCKHPMRVRFLLEAPPMYCATGCMGVGYCRSSGIDRKAMYLPSKQRKRVRFPYPGPYAGLTERHTYYV